MLVVPLVVVIHASWVSFVVCDTIVRAADDGDGTINATRTSFVSHFVLAVLSYRIPQLCHGGGWTRVHDRFTEFGEWPAKLDSPVVTRDGQSERKKER